MGIKRYIASQDTHITNAFRSDLRTRMTGSNFGNSDVNEVFSIWAQASSASVETSKILVQFPVNNIIADRNSNKIPQSGSVNFILRMFNAPHAETLPRNYNLAVQAISSSWSEGIGLDLEEGKDITKDGLGCNWIKRDANINWSIPGGDFISSSLNQSFDQGYEDLEVDISNLAEAWINGTIPNYGVGLFLPSNLVSSSNSFYTKRFFSRGSEFFFKKPIIEARWNSSTQDNRKNFFLSSSLLSSVDNTHTIYLYNYVAGQLKNISAIGTGSIYVNVYTSASNGDLVVTSPSPVTGGYVSTGIYSASFILDTTSSIVYDRWFSGTEYYHTGTITPILFDSLDSHVESKKYVVSLTNLKPIYKTNETARLRLKTRIKNWNPNIYTVASNEVENNIIDNIYYKLIRTSDNLNIVDYGTGSLNHTKLSYDLNGNFFDFDFSLLEPDHNYTFKFLFLVDNIYEEQAESFRFRVQ